ncbi:MAG: hypothetical protein COB04_02350 [Gammaproteobacteria bacterium]|nr:MAG: hypothetical protein COB04_02350 [Gammaproteobacteria bacterium]
MLKAQFKKLSNLDSSDVIGGVAVIILPFVVYFESKIFNMFWIVALGEWVLFCFYLLFFELKNIFWDGRSAGFNTYLYLFLYVFSSSVLCYFFGFTILLIISSPCFPLLALSVVLLLIKKNSHRRLG